MRIVFGGLLVILQSVRLSIVDRTIMVLVPRHGAWQLHDLRRRTVRQSPTILDSYHLTRHHQEALRAAYTRPGFITIQDGDTVFDVGAYLGAFSLAITDTAASSYCVEPSPIAARLLQENLAAYDTVTVIRKAAWQRREPVTLNHSLLPNENSLLDADMASTGDTTQVQADTIARMARDHGVDRIDFLKVEGEGAEPEILKGILDTGVTVDRIVVDCSPERGGASPAASVMRLLEDAGYACNIDRENPWDVPFVYARRDPATRPSTTRN